MSLHSKIAAIVLCLLAGAQFFARSYGLERRETLPPQLGYLSALAEEDNSKIVVLLSGPDWNGPCQLLERKVLRTWEWSSFAHDEVVFEAFDFPPANAPADEAEPLSEDVRELRAHLLEKYGAQGFPTFVVTEADGTVLSHMTGYRDSRPSHYIDWIRSL